MIQVILEGKKKTPTGGICHPPPMDVSVQTRNRPESCCCATYDCSFDTALYQTPQFSHKCRSVKIIYFMSCISDSYSLTPTWERGRPARPGAAGGRSNGLRPRCGRDARAPRVALPLQKMPNLQSPATGGRLPPRIVVVLVLEEKPSTTTRTRMRTKNHYRPSWRRKRGIGATTTANSATATVERVLSFYFYWSIVAATRSGDGATTIHLAFVFD